MRLEDLELIDTEIKYETKLEWTYQKNLKELGAFSNKRENKNPKK